MLVQNPPVAVTDNLYMLGSAEYPVYLFKGDREGAIFEGGIGAVGPLVEEQIRQLGIARELVKQLIVTHAHPDHVMAVPWFRQAFPGIRVAASEKAAATMGVEKAISFFCGVDEALTGALLSSGRLPPGSRPATLAEKRIVVDRTVKEGDTIAIDGAAFQVLQTPGHSECSLSFFEPVERILVVSDATGYFMPQGEKGTVPICRDQPSAGARPTAPATVPSGASHKLDLSPFPGQWWPNYFSGYAAYMGSIERLAGLHAEILCLSHNAVVQGADDVTEYFRDVLKATKEYHQRIVEQSKAGKPARQIAETLGAEIHAKTPLFPLDFFQKNCGLLVKMSLKHEGMG